MSGWTEHRQQRAGHGIWSMRRGLAEISRLAEGRRELKARGGCSDHNITKRLSLATHILRDEIRSESKQLKRGNVNMRRIRLRIPDWRILPSAEDCETAYELTPRKDLAQSIHQPLPGVSSAAHIVSYHQPHHRRAHHLKLT